MLDNSGKICYIYISNSAPEAVLRLTGRTTLTSAAETRRA